MLKKRFNLFWRNKNFFLVILFGLFFIVFSTFLTDLLDKGKFDSRNGVNVYFLNVGQGDAIFITLPSGENILLDGGPDLSAVFALGKVMKFYNRKIDLLILTHPDSDHYFGLVEVVKRFRINKILSNGYQETTPAYKYFKKILHNYNIDMQVVSQGDNFDYNATHLRILYPYQNNNVDDFGDKNEYSLVIKLDYFNTSFLFTGDLPQEQEKELVKSGVNLRAQVLKVGHHGSKTSSSMDFLRAVNPDFAIISVGKKNKFGHPHYRVLKNLQKVKAKILRTDILGTIHFYSNGKNIVLK